jgi:hypothetical protein
MNRGQILRQGLTADERAQRVGDIKFNINSYLYIFFAKIRKICTIKVNGITPKDGGMHHPPAAGMSRR